MARLPRFVIPGQPQHVIMRGNNRDPIFCADEDYRFYLEKLKQACDKYQCDVHAYVLMTVVDPKIWTKKSMGSDSIDSLAREE